jgi:hypothetical protein
MVLVVRNQLGPVPPGDTLQRLVEHRIIGARCTRRVGISLLVLHMASQVQVGQHGGAQGEAEKPTVVPPVIAFESESVALRVVGNEVELGMQRLW